MHRPAGESGDVGLRGPVVVLVCRIPGGMEPIKGPQLALGQFVGVPCGGIVAKATEGRLVLVFACRDRRAAINRAVARGIPVHGRGVAPTGEQGMDQQRQHVSA